LLFFIIENNNSINNIEKEERKDTIYENSSLKETEMTIKQLDYLINSQNLSKENINMNDINSSNPLLLGIENKVIKIKYIFSINNF